MCSQPELEHQVWGSPVPERLVSSISPLLSVQAGLWVWLQSLHSSLMSGNLGHQPEKQEPLRGRL